MVENQQQQQQQQQLRSHNSKKQTSIMTTSSSKKVITSYSSTSQLVLSGADNGANMMNQSSSNAKIRSKGGAIVSSSVIQSSYNYQQQRSHKQQHQLSSVAIDQSKSSQVLPVTKLATINLHKNVSSNSTNPPAPLPPVKNQKPNKQKHHKKQSSRMAQCQSEKIDTDCNENDLQSYSGNQLPQNSRAGAALNQSTTGGGGISVRSQNSTGNSWQEHIRRQKQEEQEQNSSWFDWLLCGRTCNNDQFCAADYPNRDVSGANNNTGSFNQVRASRQSTQDFNKPVRMGTEMRHRQNLAAMYDAERDENNNNHVLKAAEESSQLRMHSQKSSQSNPNNNRFKSRTRDLSKPKYTNQELDQVIFDDQMPLSNVRKNENKQDQMTNESIKSPIIVSNDLIDESLQNDSKLKNMSASCSTNLMLDIDEATPGSSQQTQLLYAERKQQTQQHDQQQTQQVDQMKNQAAQILDQEVAKVKGGAAASRDNFEVGSRHDSTISSDKSIPEEIDDDEDATSGGCQIHTSQSKISQPADHQDKKRATDETNEAFSSALQHHNSTNSGQEVLGESHPNQFITMVSHTQNNNNNHTSTTRQASHVSTMHQVQRASTSAAALEEDSSDQQFAKLEKQILSEQLLQSNQQQDQALSLSKAQQNYLNSSVETEVVVSSLQHQRDQHEVIQDSNKIQDEEDLAEFERLESELQARNSQAVVKQHSQ